MSGSTHILWLSDLFMSVPGHAAGLAPEVTVLALVAPHALITLPNGFHRPGGLFNSGASSEYVISSLSDYLIRFEIG